MASVRLELRLETELVRDAISDLVFVHEALASCHGAAFRALDRRIDDFVERGPSGADVGLTSLGDGTFLSVPSGELAAIQQEARRLGVIR